MNVVSLDKRQTKLGEGREIFIFNSLTSVTDTIVVKVMLKCGHRDLILHPLTRELMKLKR